MEKQTKKQEETEIIHYENVKPIEFLRVLRLYGIEQKYYCELRGKKKSWWHEVLNKRDYLTYFDVKTLTDDIGIATFNTLLAAVRQKHTKNKNNLNKEKEVE